MAALAIAGRQCRRPPAARVVVALAARAVAARAESLAVVYVRPPLRRGRRRARGVDEGGRLGRRAAEEARQGNERLRVGDGLCLLLGRRRRGEEPKPGRAHPMAFSKLCIGMLLIANFDGQPSLGQQLVTRRYYSGLPSVLRHAACRNATRIDDREWRT